MIIQGEDYQMKPVTDSQFDLYLSTGKKDKEGNEVFKIEAYGISLQFCIRKIIHHRMSSKLETVTLRQYLDEFNLQLIELNKVLNGKSTL